MEESRRLAAPFQQQQQPMVNKNQPFSSLSTASYFGGDAFGGDDPFQFAKPASTHYNNSQIITNVNPQTVNFMPSSQQQPPPTVAINQKPASISTFSPVQDKQFFSNTPVSTINVLPTPPTVDQKVDGETNFLTTSNDNIISVANTTSSHAGLTEQLSPTNVIATEDNMKSIGGEFSSLPTSGKDQLTNVSENPQLYHYSCSNPGSQPESSIYHSDVPSAPMSLPAFPTVQQHHTTEGSSISNITGTFTNADLPLSSALQPGSISQPIVQSSVQDNKESLPHYNLITNADISTGYGFSDMPSHSSSAANLSSLCSTPVDGRTNADFFELDQQSLGVLSTTSVNDSAPFTNSGYKDVSSTSEQLQVKPPNNAGMVDQDVTLTAAVLQPPETGLVLQANNTTNTISTLMDFPTNITFSTVPPSAVTSHTDANKSNNTVSMVSTQVTNLSTNVTQTTNNVEVFSTTTSTSTVRVSHSVPLIQSSTSNDIYKHQDVHNVQGEMKTSSTAVTDKRQQTSDAIEQQFLISPVTQSPTSAFVEYSLTSGEKHDNQLHTSSGTQSVSSLLDCPDTSILASPYKIVLPSSKAVDEEKLLSQTTRMQESNKVLSSKQTTAVTTSADVQVAAIPKISPARNTVPVTQANMTSTPKHKDNHDPLVTTPLVQQQELQQRHTETNEQQKRDYKDPTSLPPPTRQQEHEQSYHHQHHHSHHHHLDHQSQYDFDYRHSRGGGHYMEDDRGYYPPSRPHSRIPYDYYHPHPHDDYYYYRGRPEHHRDYGDDPYYYEDSRYYQERDSYYGREHPRYYDWEQSRYHDVRHPGTYGDYSEYPRSREVYDDRRMHDQDSYRYYQHPHHRAQKYYQSEGPRYPDQKENINRTDQSYVHQSHTQPLETTVAPPEASTIYGPRDHFEVSQVYNEENLHAHSSYIDTEYLGQYHEQYPEQYPDQYPSQYYGEQHQQYDQVDTVYTNEENYYEQQQQVQQELPIHPVERELPKSV